MKPVYVHDFEFDGHSMTTQVFDFLNGEIIFAFCYKGKPVYHFRTLNQTPVDIDQLQYHIAIENGYEEICKYYEGMFRYMFTKPDNS